MDGGYSRAWPSPQGEKNPGTVSDLGTNSARDVWKTPFHSCPVSKYARAQRGNLEK